MHKLIHKICKIKLILLYKIILIAFKMVAVAVNKHHEIDFLFK